MKWGLWSPTAASNSATPPDGWPEGQAPSTVNDCAREMMASIRTGMQDLQFIDQGDSPTFISSTKFSVPGNLTASYQIGRRLKLSDASTLYGTIIDTSGSAASTTVTMRMDGGNLTGSLTAVSVSVISQQNPSLPDIAYKHENVLINPYMDVWNGGTVFTFAATGQNLTADMWKAAQSLSSTAAYNITRGSASASNVPTLAQCGMVLNSCMIISVSAAVSTIGTSQFALLDTRVEGQNWRNLAQKPMAFQFWVKSNKTGTFCCSFMNGAGNVVDINEFAISSTSWEKKTLTIPPSPAAGTWDYSTGIGLIIRLVLACGTSFQGGAGNWTATAITATNNQTNFFSSAGNTMRLTGFQLQEGTQCGPLQPKNILDEELKCQRYRPTFGGGTSGNVPFGAGFAANGGQALIHIPFMVTARAQPTTFNYNGGATAGFCISQNGNNLAQASAISINMVGLRQAQLLVSVVGGIGSSINDGTCLVNTLTGATFYLTGAEL